MPGPVRRKAASKPDADRSAMYALMGFTAAAILFGYLLQSAAPFGAVGSLGSRLGPVLPPAPDFSVLMPEARLGANASAYDDDPQAPAFVVGYSSDGRLYLGLVVWDARTGRYRWTANLELAQASAALGGPPAVALERMGPAGPTLIVASGPDAGTGWTMLFRRTPDGFEPVGFVDRDGIERPTAFVIDVTAALDDVDGDGVKDLVWSAVDEVRVFRWDGSRFVWDTRLTWAYETRGRLFPAPPP